MSVHSDQSSTLINNSTLNQIIQKKLSIEDFDESVKNNNQLFADNSNRDNIQSQKDNEFQSQSQSQSQYRYQYHDNNTTTDANIQLEKLNSNAITTYVNSLNKMIHNLNIENEELKLNFVQVSEMLQNEREANKLALAKQHSQYQADIKLLQTNNEILQKEKQRHLDQNSIENEQYEIQITNYKLENEQLNSRIKKIIDENELLRKENFDTNMRLMETNKLKYENDSLKEEIKQMTMNQMYKDNSTKDNQRNKSNDRSNTKDKCLKNKFKKKQNNTNYNIKNINSNINNSSYKSISSKSFHNISNDNILNHHKEKETKAIKQNIIEQIDQKDLNPQINKPKNQKNKYQMAPYEKILTNKQVASNKQQLSLQIKKENTEEGNDNYNKNLKILKKVYDEYVLRLNVIITYV